jgi:protein gp37
MKPEWVIEVREQCERADVPFFFKQWGGIQKKRAGRKLNGRTYDEMPSATVGARQAVSLSLNIL